MRIEARIKAETSGVMLLHKIVKAVAGELAVCGLWVGGDCVPLVGWAEAEGGRLGSCLFCIM